MKYPFNHILIASDKFKGSLTALKAVEAMARGVQKVDVRTKISLVPLADGGDGTAEILTYASRARVVKTTVLGPRNQPVTAKFGLKGHDAYMDLATASGLVLIPSGKRDPMKTSTYGLGQLIKASVKKGANTIHMGVGGSATIDAGIGALSALGILFFDGKGRPLTPCGESLEKICKIDLSQCCLKSVHLKILILCDVTNPLLGAKGSVRVFGPQKGATPATVRKLENGMKVFARVVEKQFGRKISNMKYGGAAGGVPAGFYGILNSVPGVRIQPISGIDHIMEMLNLKRFVQKSSLILTGEGSLDGQSTDGKVISGITALAKKWKKPVYAFAGKVKISPSQIKKLGLHKAVEIAPYRCSLPESFRKASPWLEESVRKTLSQVSKRVP